MNTNRFRYAGALVILGTAFVSLLGCAGSNPSFTRVNKSVFLNVDDINNASKKIVDEMIQDPRFLEYQSKDKKNGTDKGIEIKLNQGDLLIYNGVDFEHWRKPFTGDVCYQTFLHYNLKNSKNKYDKRELLGLPTYARKN